MTNVLTRRHRMPLSAREVALHEGQADVRRKARRRQLCSPDKWRKAELVRHTQARGFKTEFERVRRLRGRRPEKLGSPIANKACPQAFHQGKKARGHVADFFCNLKNNARPGTAEVDAPAITSALRRPSNAFGGVGQRAARPVSVRIGAAVAALSFGRGVRTLS
jgi:hypothetical protein